jgi:hypothetical protein
VEVILDRLRQDAENLAIQEIEDVGEEQERQEDAGIRRAPSRCLGSAQKLIPSDRKIWRGLP